MRGFLDMIDYDDIDKGIVVTAILAVLMAVMMPIVIVLLFQEIFFYNQDQWLLSRPALSYIIVIGSFLVIPVAAIIYFSTKKIWKRMHPIVGGAAFLLIALMALPIAFSGMMHYYYFDDEGFSVNPLFSFEENHYAWEEIDQIALHINEEGDRASYESIELFFSVGQRYELSMNSELVTYRQRIFRSVEEHGGEILR
ncbi:hypothetical protein [Alkalicoccus saliphilus]|uniref:Uncharacterized protein n=1 Tax=Alkalicoccus saliphilus TaxID=200989 RepID=A0A2T4U9T5_9BACI|nr:hypothetical protein [Alkalicoccus saliphilus]PTL40158.1 hypothetical protein C6Y45_01910 [Alkalicoccus saliphilus]